MALLSTVGIVDNNKTQVFAQQQIPSPPFPATNAQNDSNFSSNMTAQEFLQQGIVTSSPARQNETGQIAVILPHRLDGKAYTGTLTFSASRPVEVGLVQRLPVDNATLSRIDFQKYGELSNWIRNIPGQHNLNNQTALQIITSIVPDYGISTPFFSASIPFVAHGVTLYCCSGLSGEPFIAGYEVYAKLGEPAIVNDITTTTNPSNDTGDSSD
jgi:hypothetical protein